MNRTQGNAVIRLRIATTGSTQRHAATNTLARDQRVPFTYTDQGISNKAGDEETPVTMVGQAPHS